MDMDTDTGGTTMTDTYAEQMRAMREMVIRRAAERERRDGPAEHHEMSSHGLDLGLRGRHVVERHMADAALRPADPMTCSRCGGPTSVAGQPCGECDY